MRSRVALSLAAALLCVGLAGCTSVPDAPPAPSTTPGQLDAIAAKELSDENRSFSEKYPDAALPDVPRKKFVSRADWPVEIARCLTDAGYKATVNTSGGIDNVPVADAQRPAYDLAVHTCRLQYPLDPKLSVPYSDQELSYLYRYFAGPLKSCLKQHKEDTGDIPSEQRFKQTYGTEDSWNPYLAVTDLSESQWATLRKVCTPLPSGMRSQ